MLVHESAKIKNPKGYENPQLLITADDLGALLGLSMRRFKSSKRGHVQKSRKHRLSAENLELGSERLLIGDKRTLVLDLRPADVFAAGHIQTAVHIDLFGVSLIDTDPTPLEAFLWMIVHMFEGRGVSEDCRVVVYDDRSGMRAARAFWFLEFFGHTDVQMLDGGFTAWKSAGWPVTIDAMVPISHVWKIRRTDERLATWCHVRDRIGHEGVVVVDTRSEGEYLGETVRARRAGAIPGAIHVEWTRNLDPAGAFKTAHELKDMYEKVGVAPGCEVITYCQGGYRAAHSYLALRLLGYPSVRNYIGSWKEWANREELPIKNSL